MKYTISVLSMLLLTKSCAQKKETMNNEKITYENVTGIIMKDMKQYEIQSLENPPQC